MKKNILQCLVVILFSFYFLSALQSDINSLAARAKMSLSRAQNILMPKNINSIVILIVSSLGARAKMSLSRAQNIFMPANINSIVILERILLA